MALIRKTRYSQKRVNSLLFIGCWENKLTKEFYFSFSSYGRRHNKEQGRARFSTDGLMNSNKYYKLNYD